jgi:SAM-dependent methyltransferase
LEKALHETFRVLKPNGRFILSDPVCETKMPENLINDERLRALCLSGAIPLQKYLDIISHCGFGTIEIRAKRPYRILSPKRYETEEIIHIESVEICAIKDPIPEDGPCVFSGRTAIYFGDEEYFDDKKGHVLMSDQPLPVCDKTAKDLIKLNHNDIYISNSTYFYDGGGCC